VTSVEDEVMDRPRVTLRLPKLYAKQAEFVHCPSKYTVCFASTKAGKSVGLLAWILSEMWVKGALGRDWYWIAPAYGVAKIMFRRVQRWLNKADKAKRIWHSNESELYIELLNGARVYFKGGDRPDLLYGGDAWGVVLDEGTRMREEILHVATSITTKTDGPIKIIGNMKTRGHWMYKMWMRGKQGDPDVTPFKLDAWDAVEGGVLQRSVVESAQRNLPAHVFKMLYLAEPDDVGNNPFGLQFIAAAKGPGSIAPASTCGVDLAKSIDWTVVLGLDVEGQCTLFERWQSPWEATTPRILRLIGSTPTWVDSTGVGDPIVERLQKGRQNVRGYKYTNATKQVLMEGLAVALQNYEIGGLPDVVIDELEQFEYEYTATGVRYTAPEGMHDDGVNALALAVLGLNKRNRHRAVTLPEGDALQNPFGDD
jgi:hypothetical protein